MIDSIDVIELLGSGSLEQNQEDGRQPAIRLDINRVITRIYDKNGFPFVYINKQIYSFSNFVMFRTGNIIEIKYYQWQIKTHRKIKATK